MDVLAFDALARAVKQRQAEPDPEVTTAPLDVEQITQDAVMRLLVIIGRPDCNQRYIGRISEVIREALATAIQQEREHARRIIAEHLTTRDLAPEPQASASVDVGERMLRSRATWYMAGCEGLEDTPGYLSSGDCARDAGADIAAALGLLDAERATHAETNGALAAMTRRAKVAEGELEAERATVQAQIAALRERDAAARVPGVWLCETCGYRLQMMKLRASDMAVGVDGRLVETICPNDGTSLRALTWKEDAEASDRVGIAERARADAAEARCVELAEARHLADMEAQQLRRTLTAIRECRFAGESPELCLRQAAWHGGFATCLLRVAQQTPSSIGLPSLPDQAGMFARSAWRWAAVYRDKVEKGAQ